MGFFNLRSHRFITYHFDSSRNINRVLLCSTYRFFCQNALHLFDFFTFFY